LKIKKCNTAPVEQRGIAAGLLPLKEAVSPYGYPAHTATNSLSLDEGRRCSTRVPSIATPPWPLSNCLSQPAPGQLQPHCSIPLSWSPANQLSFGQKSRM